MPIKQEVLLLSVLSSKDKFLWQIFSTQGFRQGITGCICIDATFPTEDLIEAKQICTFGTNGKFYLEVLLCWIPYLADSWVV